eukprot:2169904-Amphidinium_carterae.1
MTQQVDLVTSGVFQSHRQAIASGNLLAFNTRLAGVMLRHRVIRRRQDVQDEWMAVHRNNM